MQLKPHSFGKFINIFKKVVIIHSVICYCKLNFELKEEKDLKDVDVHTTKFQLAEMNMATVNLSTRRNMFEVEKI